MTVAAEFHTSVASKIVVILLGGSAVLWVALLLAGLASGERLGYLAFATLIASVGVVLATAISLRAPPRTYNLARITWMSWAAVILILGILLGDSAGGTVIAYSMAAISFPVGLVALPLIGVIAGKISATWLGMVVMWAACAGIGYLQWFVVLPKALRREVQTS